MMDPLTRQIQPIKRRIRKTPLSVRIQQSFRVLVALLILIGGTSMTLFLYTNSLKPAKGYILKQLQLNYEKLSSESRNLEYKMIEAQSYINLEEKDSIKYMEEMNSENFKYAESESGFAYNE